jgi:SAM-dependent methyltransferase
MNYENFHRNSTLQKKIINKYNFTYRNYLSVISSYLDRIFKILDIGCGTGTIDFFLAKKCKNVTGIDISEKAIKLCKENSKIFRLDYLTNFYKVNFPKEKIEKKFDSIIFFEVLEHVKEENFCLKIIYNSLFENGLFFISVPSKNSPFIKTKMLLNFDKEVGHLRRYDPELLKNKLYKNGFTVLKCIKTGGVLRDILFLNKKFSFIIKILNNSIVLSTFFTIIDNFLLKIFGESNIILIAQKK